ncbi:MAG: UDP-2,4-diacetamido-2,4,6-trideoxy-beta-L-altropyranose hydrolase [Clostridiales bacterium]|nr:UDP-2,4-diacetamido-2,4,6-trideoxy-beta-L-altropyranose hydrolase [Clostridiales bacterium]
MKTIDVTRMAHTEIRRQDLQENSGKQTIYIRADGNSQIGVGHQMRCLSIADELVKRNQKVVFLTADESGTVLPKSRGYECIVLYSDDQKPMEEIPKLRELLQKECRKAVLLLDSYALTQEYAEALKEAACLVYLDDYGKEYWPVDCVINYNIYGPDMPYDRLYPGNRKTGDSETAAGQEKILLLLGSTYAPLRKEFADTKHIPKKQVTDVLITTGGADAYNVAGQLAERLAAKVNHAGNRTDHADNREKSSIRYHVVSGAFHTFREYLQELSGKYPNIIIHENVTQMAELMEQCDLAVSAAGSTLYELCAVQVPTVYFHFVENQELPARYFKEKTEMIGCGNFADEPEQVLERLYQAVRRIEQDEQLRNRIAESMKNVTDGKGAERIAECLCRRFQRKN